MSKQKEALKIPPIVKGYFMWNENSFGLDFVQTSSGKGIHPLLDPANEANRTTGRSFDHNSSLPSHAMNQTSRSRIGAHPRGKESTIVSLQDVKAVAINLLITDRLQRGYHNLSKYFDSILTTENFESLLIYLLRYFECFFQRLDLKQRLNESTFLHPSKAELNQAEKNRSNLIKARQSIAEQYCALVLGIGMTDLHHMGCGQKRNSNSYRDKNLFEEIYSFFTFLVWVTFGRRNYQLIFTEVGDLLRSETFNPANQRVYKRMFNKLETSASKKELNIKDKKLFRLPKRPPITSIINQRSKVLSTLLPSSKEQASYLYGQSQNSTMQLKDIPKNEFANLFSLHEAPTINPGERLGIIGASFELYNRKDLTLLETEEEKSTITTQQNEKNLLLDNPPKVVLPKISSKNHQKRAFSRVTTAEGKTFSQKDF